MNQQQLQTARAALWHQSATAPGSSASSTALATYDDAAAWLDEMGLCLFLPRHAQLPAPAPSFVEACMGSARALPPPDAIAHATELADRLVAARRAVPLNLLGTYTEQPDFLVAAEALPWVAGIRGERQWKAAPAGRTSPLVLRTWEALDREGESTAVDLRELLGRELTEAAVLRALIELWTGLRAMPLSAPGQPTRWTLLKHRHPTELATGANTGQATALSALLSIYLRSAVAASAEEAEVFLSPLTSRSRIREVLHGMTAARQFGTMSVASQTLLFVEGSLPEVAAEPEAETPAAATPAPRRPFREQTGQGPRRAPASRPGREPREQRPYKRPDARPGRRAEARPGPESRSEKNAAESFGKPPFQKPFRKFDKGPFPQASGGGPRNEDRDRGARPGKSAAKPWQRSGPNFRRPESGARPARPWQKTNSDAPASSGAPGGTKRPARTEGRSGPPRPWREKPAGSGFRKPFGKQDRPRPGNRPAGGERSSRGPYAPARKFPGARKTGGSSPRFARPESARPAASGAGSARPSSRPGSARPGSARPGFARTGSARTGSARTGSARPGYGAAGSRPRPSGGFAARPPRSSEDRPGRPFGEGKARPFGSAKFPAGRSGSRPGSRPGPRSARDASRPPHPGGRSAGGGQPFKKTFKKPFRKANSSPRKQNPRKNRNQEEPPE